MISKQEKEYTEELTRLCTSHSDPVYTNYSELDILEDLCCKAYGVTIDDFKSKCRKRHYAECRHTFFFLAYNYTSVKYSQKTIGKFAGNRDHTTVIHGISSVYDRMDYDDGLVKIINSIFNDFNRLSKWAV